VRFAPEVVRTKDNCVLSVEVLSEEDGLASVLGELLDELRSVKEESSVLSLEREEVVGFCIIGERELNLSGPPEITHAIHSAAIIKRSNSKSFLASMIMCE
jgi:hypothetical protein